MGSAFLPYMIAIFNVVMTTVIDSTWIWSNFHFLKDSTLVTSRGHQKLSIFLWAQFVTTFHWYNCKYNIVVHNGHDNAITKKIEIKMWKSKMLPLEFFYLDSTTNIHKNWTKKTVGKSLLGWINLQLKYLENVARHVHRCPGKEFNAECPTPIAKQSGGKNPGLGVFDCHKCQSYLPHRMFFASEYIKANFNAPHRLPSFVQLGGINIKSYFSRTMTQNIQQSQ